MVVEQLDGENLLFNSDYPHADSAFPGSVKKFLDQPISDEAKRKILWDNTVRLYGQRVADVINTIG